jgi:hypothetical protein
MAACDGVRFLPAGSTRALGCTSQPKLIADIYQKHKIIPKGSVSWDNQGNNKAYQSRQVICVLNPSSIYAHLAESDKKLYAVTGMLPVPARPGRGDRGTEQRGMAPAQAQPLPRGGQRAGPELHGAGAPAGGDGGRGRTMGAALQGHVHE